MHANNDRRVNLLLSSYVWTRPLNTFGVKQHVFALYEAVFKGYQQEIYPKNNKGGLLSNTIRHIPVLLKGKLNVVSQGYPIMAAAVATLLKRDLGLIVHTWKVPGYTEKRLAARLYDVALRRAINHAKAVVVVSLTQKRQLESQGVKCPIFFAPVSVDTSFWRPNPPDKEAILERFGLKEGEYVLTVGGSDRDEVYAAKVARMAGKRYVRSTYHREIAKAASEKIAGCGLSDISTVLVNPSYEELCALYAGAWMVCLPTKTETNPAGLTSLVEAMACGAIVSVPNTISEGYIQDGVNGFTLCGTVDEFCGKINNYVDSFAKVKESALRSVHENLNNECISKELANQLDTIGLVFIKT